jgi:hypothetical protein
MSLTIQSPYNFNQKARSIAIFTRFQTAANTQYHYDSENQMMRVDGAQVIGFKCHMPPKSPDPLASITQWI